MNCVDGLHGMLVCLCVCVCHGWRETDTKLIDMFTAAICLSYEMMIVYNIQSVHFTIIKDLHIRHNHIKFASSIYDLTVENVRHKYKHTCILCYAVPEICFRKIIAGSVMCLNR